MQDKRDNVQNYYILRKIIFDEKQKIPQFNYKELSKKKYTGPESGPYKSSVDL